MIISYPHKFIFIHVAKTGGSSVDKALRPFAHDPLQYPENRVLDRLGVRINHWSRHERRRFRRHVTAQALRKRLPRDVFDESFKFAFVRNPWDWMVSYYSFIRECPAHHLHKRGRSMSFEDFLQFEIKRRHGLQSASLTDKQGRILVDFVGRFERLTEDFLHVCRILQVCAPIEHCNRSHHADYRDYYTRRTRALLADHLRQDIERFGYSFDGHVEHSLPLRSA